jgi:hypothetical protein
VECWGPTGWRWYGVEGAFSSNVGREGIEGHIAVVAAAKGDGGSGNGGADHDPERWLKGSQELSRGAGAGVPGMILGAPQETKAAPLRPARARAPQRGRSGSHPPPP